MSEENKIFVSQYENILSKVPKEIKVVNELYKIQNGYYRDAVEKCRNFLMAGKTFEYKNAKSILPAVTFSGTFSGTHKRENLETYSKLIIIDIDGLDYDKIELKKKLLFTDPHVMAVWASPSNRGIKILIKTQSEPDIHKLYFDELSNYVFANYGLEVDKSGSDICRLCFSSYDPSILIKLGSCTPFSVDLSTFSERNLLPSNFINLSKLNSSTLSDSKLDKVLFYSTENRNRQNDRESIVKIIKYFKKCEISITKTYENWYKVGLAIANTFTYDLGKTYFLDLCRLDGANHDEYKSIWLLEYCYRNRKPNTVNFATILYLAELNGFTPNVARVRR